MISHFFIDRPIFASVLSIVLVLAGVVAWQALPVEQYPNVTPPTVQVTALPNEAINPVFEAATDASSEAILNAMLAAETMTGADGRRVFALPHDRLLQAMRKYRRIP